MQTLPDQFAAGQALERALLTFERINAGTELPLYLRAELHSACSEIRGVLSPEPEEECYCDVPFGCPHSKQSKFGRCR